MDQSETPQPSRSSGDSEPHTVRRHTAAVGVEPFFPPARLLRTVTIEAEQQRSEAAAELAAARAEARRMLDEAAREAEGLIDTARAEGVRRGLDSLSSILTKASDELDSFRRRLLDAEQRTAYRIAREVIEVEFAVRPERVRDLVAEALDAAEAYKSISVFVSPSDFGVISEAREQLVASIGEKQVLEFLSDDTLGRNEIRVETEMGAFTRSLEQRLAVLRDLEAESDGGGA